MVEVKLIESGISSLVWYTIPYIHNECVKAGERMFEF